MCWIDEVIFLTLLVNIEPTILLKFALFFHVGQPVNETVFVGFEYLLFVVIFTGTVL